MLITPDLHGPINNNVADATSRVKWSMRGLGVPTER